jgi:hypothetical protein
MALRSRLITVENKLVWAHQSFRPEMSSLERACQVSLAQPETFQSSAPLAADGKAVNVELFDFEA